MVIANNKIKIQSNYIQEVLSNPDDYDSIKVDVNINCCTADCAGLEATYTLPIEGTKWFVDLTTPVGLENFIAKLNVGSLVNFTEVNVITSPIDLGYIADNCSSADCTLETNLGYFAPLFKTQLDAFFLSVGIVTDVTITFDGNILEIDDMPEGFIPASLEYGVDAPYTKLPISFGELNSKAFISSDAIYLQPNFFASGEFIDGIYKISLKFIKADEASFILDTSCAFIDIETKCDVAALLKYIKVEAEKGNMTLSATNAHLLHYGLVNGSNCGCNCDVLCDMFTELNTILNSVNPNLLDCGC